VEKYSAQVPRRIPDLDQAFSQLNFGPVGTIVEAQLEFQIRHTCRGDLWMELRHPDGTTYTASGPADCGGTWEGPIGVPAEGKVSNGVWSLTVMDTQPQDSGTLEAWGLRLLIRR
jgi:subtilisin-like proprotein convertase family protein